MATTPERASVATLAKGARITGETRDGLRERMVQRYASGESIRALATEAGRSYGFVHGLLVEAGVELRGRGGATRGASPTTATKATATKATATKATADAKQDTTDEKQKDKATKSGKKKDKSEKKDKKDKSEKKTKSEKKDKKDKSEKKDKKKSKK